MNRKFAIILSVLIMSAMLISGCMRQQQTSSEEDPSPSAAQETGQPTDEAGQPSDEAVFPSIEPKPVDTSELVPFSKEVGSDILYGYMDPEGNTIIEPKFGLAYQFYDCGLAIVSDTEGKSGVIDKTGQYIVEPITNYLTYEDGIFTGYEGNEDVTYAYDKTGALLFKRPGYISVFSDGLASVQGETEKGYIDITGKLAINLSYGGLGDFTDGYAIVLEEYNGPSWLIDKNGNDVTDSVSSGIYVIQSGVTDLFGYMDKDENNVTDMIFSEALPFMNGYAIVNASEDSSQPRYGIINEKGDYVLEPKYVGIQRMRNGSFAVGPEITEDAFAPPSFFYYTPKALYSKDLTNHTDSVFTDLGDLDKNYVCVTDGKKIYYLDADLKKAGDLPEFSGSGLMLPDGDKLRGTLNGAMTVADREGNILSRDQQLRFLSDNISTVTVTEYPDAHTTISYPVLKGMTDRRIQEDINQTIRDKAASQWQPEDSEDPYSFTVVEISSSVTMKKDLLNIDMSSYGYTMGAAHPGNYVSNIFINAKTGKTYTGMELFKSPEEAAKKLGEIITKHVLEKPDDYLVDEVTPADINYFWLTDDGICVYFNQYEIASYAAGMQEFNIPFSEISDLINTDGEFWKSFN